MGIFRQFPYTNFHELNAEWILKQVKDLIEEWANYHAQWDVWQADINAAIADLKTFIDEFIDNLDIEQVVSDKIDEMVESGEFIRIIAQYLPYVTPEMFGAVGDGSTDDTQAFIDAIATTRPVICDEKTYAVTSITISSAADIYGNGCTIKSIGTSSWVSPINAADADLLKIRNMTFEGIGIPTDTATYHSVIEARRVNTVYLDHITAHNFYNRTPEIVGDVDERHAVLFTMVDCEKVDILNSEFYDLTGGEICYISQTTQALEDAAVVNFVDNYIHDISDVGNIKANSFNIFGGMIRIEHNIIDAYVTDYTYFNLKGSLVYCLYNNIINGKCFDVFDAYEAGYLNADKMIVEGNHVEAQNGTLVKFRGMQCSVRSNYFKGSSAMFGSSGYRSDSIFSYPVKGAFAGSQIEISDNVLELAYIDENHRVEFPFMPWAKGSFSGLNDGSNLETLIIKDNTINMSSSTQSSPRDTRTSFLELWNNVNNVIVEGNTLINPVRGEISATLYFWIIIEAVVTGTMKKVIFQNNTLSDSELTSQSLYIRKGSSFDDTVPVIASAIDLFNVNAAGAITSNISNAGNLIISNFLTTRTDTVTGAVNHYIIPLRA